MTVALAPAKLNLALVVGPRRADGRHELVTLMQPLALADEIELEPADALEVTGFAGDTLIRAALESVAAAAKTEPRWRARIEKRIPVAAGLGGGSSDAAAALRLANETLSEPLAPERLAALAAALGADVPFFLTPGPKLARGDGTVLEPVELPRGFTVLLLLPRGATKGSTGAVYQAFDERRGERDFEQRRAELERELARIERAEDLTRLAPNDLASSPLTRRLNELGAFRADVTGAGPTLYGLFSDRSEAELAERELAPLGRTWITEPAW